MREVLKETYVEMSLPASRDMMLTVRLAASGVLARTALTVGALEDLKLAIEEACSCLISQLGKDGRINLRFDMCAEKLVFICRCDEGCRTGEPMDATEQEVALCILQSLVDSAEMQVEAGYVASIALTMALSR